MDWFDRILAWGVERPDRVALASGSRRVTYGELIGRAHGLAAHLSSVLADDGSPVAVVGHKEPEMVVGFLARGSGRTSLRPHRQRHASGARLTHPRGGGRQPDADSP